MGRPNTSIKTQYPGITVRAHQRSNTINLHFSYCGISCREPLPGLDPSSATDLKAANQLLGEINRKITLEQFHYIDYFPKGAHRKQFGFASSKQTLRKALEKMVDTAKRQGKANSSIRSYRTCANRLAPLHGTLLVYLQPAMIQEFFLSLVERQLASKTLSMTLSVLRITLDQAVIDKSIRVNPLTGLKLSTLIKQLSTRQHTSCGAKAAIEPFNNAEIQAIIAHCENDSFRYLVTVGFFTGLRLEELIALEWGDIDLHQGLLHVRRARCLGQTKAPKTKAGLRSVALTEQALTALKAQRLHTQLLGKLVFLNPNTGQQWDSQHSSLRRHWRVVLENAGVKYRYPYQMRHTFASNMIFAGAEHLFIARQLGHSDLHSLYKTYARQIDAYHLKENRPVNNYLDSIAIASGHPA